ncbi:peptide deformylase [Patescibacteria group bacterium]|nr:peptide deformylase [Patescibacteria group bacterium]
MAKLLPITYFPCKDLRKKSKKVVDFKSKEFQQLILDMDKTMQEKDGLGLAAPQIGKNINMVVINTSDGSIVLINPKIMRKSWKKESAEEGCLSLPDIYGMVNRHKIIRVTAFDKQGKKIKFIAEDLFARVIQHEIDHLRGVLFIDKAKEITKGKDKLEEMKKNDYC